MVCMGTQRIELLGDADRPGAWMLLVEGIPQSHVDLDDPRHLELEYMRRLGHVADLAAPAGAPLRVLHLGGGGLTLARYVAATRPGSCQVAVESDAEVAGLVQRRLPLAPPPAGQISVRVADARAALEQFLSPTPADGSAAGLPPLFLSPTPAVGSAAGLPPQFPASSFDVVVCDVFAGAQTPGHVTSAELTAMAARVLAPSGIYAVNVGDGPPLAHARARAA